MSHFDTMNRLFDTLCDDSNTGKELTILDKSGEPFAVSLGQLKHMVTLLGEQTNRYLSPEEVVERLWSLYDKTRPACMPGEVLTSYQVIIQNNQVTISLTFIRQSDSSELKRNIVGDLSGLAERYEIVYWLSRRAAGLARMLKSWKQDFRYTGYQDRSEYDPI